MDKRRKEQTLVNHKLPTKEVPLASMTTGYAPLEKSPVRRGLSFSLMWPLECCPIVNTYRNHKLTVVQLSGAGYVILINQLLPIIENWLRQSFVPVFSFQLKKSQLRFTLQGGYKQGECTQFIQKKIRRFLIRCLPLSILYC